MTYSATTLTFGRTKILVKIQMVSFGLDFFQNLIVEIDFHYDRIALHEKLPRKVEKYERLKIETKMIAEKSFLSRAAA
ncbi:MAG: hypothetical protein IPJ07_13485 [Acidobacteria bacterium]|nr:hypothetical protein [Acidobacteriota bacterium]